MKKFKVGQNFNPIFFSQNEVVKVRRYLLNENFFED